MAVCDNKRNIKLKLTTACVLIIFLMDCCTAEDNVFESKEERREKRCVQNFDFQSKDVPPDLMVNKKPPTKICMPLLFARNYPFEIEAIYAVSYCSSANSPYKMKCQLDYKTGIERVNKLEDLLPVTDTRDQITYRNKHCALCNEIDVKFLYKWQAHIGCDRFIRFPDEKTLLQRIVFGYINCTIDFLDEKRQSLESDDCGTSKMLSGMDQINNTGVIEMAFIGSKRSFPFSGLLKLEEDSDLTPLRISKCPPGHTFHEPVTQCLEITCFDGQRLVDKTCMPQYDNIQLEKGLYNVFFRLVLAEEVDSKTAYNLTEVLPLQDILRQTLDKYIPFTFCEKSILLIQSIPREILATDNGTKDSNNIFLYYDVLMKFIITRFHNPENVAAAISQKTKYTFSTSFNNTRLDGIAYIMDDLENKYSPGGFSGSSRTDKYNPHLCYLMETTVKLTLLKTCPLVTVDRTNLPWVEQTNALEFVNSNVYLNLSDFIYDESKNIIKICLHIYEAIIGNASQNNSKPKETNLAEFILSLVLFSLSTLSLLVTLIAYSLFQKLRTLPGVNNMSLSASLLLAQSFYFIGNFANMVTESISCKIVGMFIHFFWLLSLFWMNVCTFHMTYVLTRTRVVHQTAFSKRFFFYHLYSFVMAASIVAANILVASFESDGLEIGYGKRICYISSQRLVSLTLGIPVLLIVIVNSVMFLTTICKVSQAGQAHVHSQKKRHDLLVFIKLSSVTGTTWIFGIIYQRTGLAVFSYLFTIFNGCQGVFLMFSFVINKRVLNMLIERFPSTRFLNYAV